VGEVVATAVALVGPAVGTLVGDAGCTPGAHARIKSMGSGTLASMSREERRTRAARVSRLVISTFGDTLATSA
jgi:hypothetical protein